MKNKIKRINESDLVMKPVDREKISNISQMHYAIDRDLIQDVIDRILEYGPSYIEKLSELNEKFVITKSKRYPR